MPDAPAMQYSGLAIVYMTDELGREWSVQVPVAVAIGAKELEPVKAKALAERACLKALAMAGDEARAYIIKNRRAIDISEQLKKEPPV